jgi:serine/threonine protein kinase/Flp pilus assembly protein TadD
MIQKLGKYKILDKLGEGAMGSVYRAYDNILDRDVAIKIMADDIKWNPELKLRFYREARSAAGVHHPNIVTIYDLGEEGKTTFIVMEYLQGKNLKQIIQEKPLMPLEKKLAIIAQVADGLNHAHDGGLIHRDIKPANIFVTTLGTAKILDFGIARIPASSLTRVGDRLGTPIYMSPELVRGTNYDARSDIFSAGIVFYEFFTYHHPFREARFDKTLDNILFKKDLPFAEQFPDAPEGLWPILNTCLAKEPENRYANMGEAAQACRALIDRLNLISQQMANQISAVMPNLRLESQKQDAPPSLTRLWAEAQDLLSREQKPDYLSLLRLVNAFNEEPFIQTLAGSAAARREEPAPSPGISPEESKTGAGKPAGEAPVQKPPAAAEAESTARDDISPASSAAQADRDAEIRAPQPQKTPAPPPAPLPQDEATKSEDKLRGAKMLADAEKLLAEDRLEEALDLLRAAIGPLGPVDTLVRKLAETRRKIEARNRTQVSKLLATAKEAVQARQFPNAVEALDKVLELEPGKADATELRRKALAEIESEKAEQMRREEGERNKVTGFKFLAEKKYSESLRMLRQAAEMLGEDETINIGIEESEEGLRAEELHARVLSELMRSHKLFQSGNLNGARTAVHGVLELSPRNEEARELLSRIEKAEQEKNKQAAIASLLRESREAMNQKKFGEALSLANEALGRDPANAEIRNMIQSINQAKEETRRRQEAAELFVKIEESISRQDLDEAESRANSALAVIPNDPVAMEYLKKINLAREEQRKAQEIDNAVSEARQAFQKGDLAQCETVARRILALDPKESRAGDLLNRIAQIRDSKRREKINAVIAQGYTALQAADYQTAAACAKEALQTDAQNEAAEKLLAAIGQAKSDRVQARIAELLSLSRDALSRDQYDKAASLANEILALDAKHK